MRTHTVAAAEFHDLAAGFGTARGVRALRAAQVDRRLLMLREVLRSVRPGSPAEAAYELFCAAQRHAGEAVAEVVAAPHFGAWVTAALREMRAVPAQPSVRPALPYLGNLAVSAAIRAGIDFTIELPADDGVFLPGLGHAARGRNGAVPVRGAQGRYAVADAELPADLGSDAANWSALRVISAEHDGCAIRLVLDDLDPYRDMHGLNAGGRLPGAAVRRWAHLLGEAWPQLVRRHRRYAEAIAAGLTTVVPLTPPESGHGINATVMHAFGAVALTPPKDGLGLAASLLHEFQHAKLGALLDLLPMYEDSGVRRFYAPWRDDPRPLSGLFQGVYAFMGVADFWRAERRHLTGGAQRFADFEFARWRERVDRCLRLLRSRPEFNEDGRRFLAGMQTTVDGWLAEPVLPLSAELATEAAEDHWAGWRLRNVRPDEEHVRTLRDAWLAGNAARTGAVPSQVVADDKRSLARNARIDLAVQRTTDPQAFQGTCAAPSELTATGATSTPADLAYARNDFETAATAYRDWVGAEPEERAAWAGLALSRARCGGGQVWRGTPELPYAVHLAIRATGAPAPDPIALGEWLETGRSDADHVGGGSTTQ